MSDQTQARSELATAELVELLTVTQRALSRELGCLLEDEGVSVEQWRVLRTVETPEGRQMGDLSVMLETPAPTLTRLVDGLIDASYLYRTQSEQDRRRVSVHLAARGRTLLARLDAIAVAHEAALARHIGADVTAGLLHGLRTVRDRTTQ